MDAIEILNSVDQFYNSAWNKLIIIITVSIVVVGILIPLLITWWQNRILKIKEDSLKREFEDSIQELKHELTKLITDELLKKFKKLQEQIDNKMSAVQAQSFHLQANTYIKDNMSRPAVFNFITAGYGYLKGKDFANLNQIHSVLASNISKLTLEELEELETEDQEPSSYVKHLQKNNENGIFRNVIRDIKKAITKIKGQKKPAIKK